MISFLFVAFAALWQLGNSQSVELSPYQFQVCDGQIDWFYVWYFGGVNSSSGFVNVSLLTSVSSEWVLFYQETRYVIGNWNNEFIITFVANSSYGDVQFFICAITNGTKTYFSYVNSIVLLPYNLCGQSSQVKNDAGNANVVMKASLSDAFDRSPHSFIIDYSNTLADVETSLVTVSLFQQVNSKWQLVSVSNEVAISGQNEFVMDSPTLFFANGQEQKFYCSVSNGIKEDISNIITLKVLQSGQAKLLKGKDGKEAPRKTRDAKTKVFPKLGPKRLLNPLNL